MNSKGCKYCNGENTLYQSTRHTNLYINTFGGATVIVTECNGCPPYANCWVNNFDGGLQK